MASSKIGCTSNGEPMKVEKSEEAEKKPKRKIKVVRSKSAAEMQRLQKKRDAAKRKLEREKKG